MKKYRLSGDDRGSLPLAMMIVAVGLVMSVAMLPLIVSQVTSTRSFVDREMALNGAQVGMDVMMARVRAAAENQSGLLEDLPTSPCVDKDPDPNKEDLVVVVTGDSGVTGTDEKLKYAVEIRYFNQEGGRLRCDPLTEVPATASLTSAGTGSAATRTLTGTYTFSSSNTNIPGGMIRVAKYDDKNLLTTGETLCMDAGSAPADGTGITMQPCNQGSRTQQFGYTKDLYLKLMNSETPTAALGLCLYAGAGNTHSSGAVVKFSKCPEPAPQYPKDRTPQFQWSLDGNSEFKSTGWNPTTKKPIVESLCVSLEVANKLGARLLLNSACTVDETKNVWRSTPGVGAGMAGDDTNQLVNFDQFSRCLDVTDQKVDAKYMIAWFCKQSPSAEIDWNQIWVHPMPAEGEVSKVGAIVVTYSSQKYCLKSPLSTASNAYTLAVKCPTNYTDVAALDKSLKWIVYHDTGNYATSYQIEDGSGSGSGRGLCLQPTDLNANPKDTHTDGTSKIKVEVCNKSELQKWNAPANIGGASPLSNISEK